MTRYASLAALALVLPCSAQETTFTLDHGRRTPAERQIYVSMLPTPASGRLGGFGYALLELENRDRRQAHRIEIRFSSQLYSSARFSVRKTVRLEAGEQTRIFLPLPGLQEAGRLEMDVDGYAGNSSQNLNTSPGNVGPSVLMVSAEGARSLRWQSLFQAQLNGAATSSRGRTTSRGTRSGVAFNFTTRLPAQLPDQWTLLSGFDMVILDGGAPDLLGEHQEILRRYLAAGGSLHVVRSEVLPEGPLRDLIESTVAEDSLPQGHLGVGRWLAMEGDLDSRASRMGARLETWWGDGSSGVLATAAARSNAGPVPDALYGQLQIPGLGDVPVHLFFILILGFAILVGPVNHFYFSRRRRKPLMLLLTVPALGFGFTAAILLYGVFSEGFGISGRIRSVTVLDQRNHEATTVASRTLYAGLAPSHLSPSTQTYLFSTQFQGRWGDPRSHGLNIDMDRGGRLDGAALPSRNLTALVTVTQGISRERLRFRRLGDGSLEVLAGPEFAPVADGLSLVLCDLDGNYYVREDSSVLRRSSRREVGRMSDRLRREFSGTSGPRGGRAQFEAWLQDVVPDSLPPGSYLAIVTRGPGIDDLGLDVEYIAAEHLVVGRLDAEDFVE